MMLRRLLVAGVVAGVLALPVAGAAARITGPDEDGCYALRGRTICVQLPTGDAGRPTGGWK